MRAGVAGDVFVEVYEAGSREDVHLKHQVPVANIDPEVRCDTRRDLVAMYRVVGGEDQVCGEGNVNRASGSAMTFMSAIGHASEFGLRAACDVERWLTRDHHHGHLEMDVLLLMTRSWCYSLSKHVYCPLGPLRKCSGISFRYYRVSERGRSALNGRCGLR